jgi:murein DD-endopeptidase MepM/ murein hydrolase activator NlpD
LTISEVQGRIAQIQAMLALAGGRPVGATTPASSATPTSSGQFAAALDQAVRADRPVAPAEGAVSSEYGPRWGQMHEGIDIAAASGSPVRAVADGVVRSSAWNGGYGNTVIIDHGDGARTLYAHNSRLDVRPGERVSAGQVIARVGSTGDSTGPHLHFEVEVDGEKVDPRPWLSRRGVSL